MIRSLDDLIRTHEHICWYPSANADFRGLLYLSDRYFKWKKIHREEGQHLPDLFLMTDIYPQDTPAYAGRGSRLAEEGYTNISFLTDDRWKRIEELYVGYRLNPWEGTRREVTKITVSKIEQLQKIELGFRPEFFRSSNLEQKPGHYGRAFYIQAHVSSVQREGSPEPKRHEYDCEIVYVLADNTSFARDYLLKKKISTEYVIQIRYGDNGFGGSAVPGSWVNLILGSLKCHYFMANPRYAEAADEEILPAEIRDFFHGYQLKPAFCDQIASFRDYRYCLYESGDDWDDINFYRVKA